MYLPGQLGVLEEVGGSPPEVTCPSRSGHIIYTPTSLLRKLKPGEAVARAMAFSGPQSWKLIEVGVRPTSLSKLLPFPEKQ